MLWQTLSSTKNKAFRFTDCRHGKKISDRFASLRIIWKRIRESNADVFHFHDPELLLLAPLIKLIKRKPQIFDVHEHYILSIREKHYIPRLLRSLVCNLYLLYEWFALKFVTKVFYTTSTVGARYRKWKGRDAVQVGNVPSQGLFPETPPALSEREQKAVFVGHMMRMRGILEVIESFRTVVDKHPSYELLLVGSFYSDSFEAEVREKISQMGLEKNVILKGKIPYEKLKKLLYRCQIGFVTYLSYGNNMACLPNKMFEYMGAGMVIVASNFEGYREILEANRCGVHVPPESVEDIAAAVIALIEDPEKSSRLARTARSKFENLFNWETEQKEFLNHYSELDSLAINKKSNDK